VEEKATLLGLFRYKLVKSGSDQTTLIVLVVDNGPDTSNLRPVCETEFPQCGPKLDRTCQRRRHRITEEP